MWLLENLKLNVWLILFALDGAELNNHYLVFTKEQWCCPSLVASEWQSCAVVQAGQSGLAWSSGSEALQDYIAYSIGA